MRTWVHIFDQMFVVDEWNLWKLGKAFNDRGIETRGKTISQVVAENGGEVVEQGKQGLRIHKVKLPKRKRK